MRGIEVSAKHIQTEPLEYSFGLVAKAEDSGRPSRLSLAEHDVNWFQSFPSFCAALAHDSYALAWLGHVTADTISSCRCLLELAQCEYPQYLSTCRYLLALASARSFLSGAATRSSLFVHVPTVCRTIGAIVVRYSIHSDSHQCSTS